MAFPGDIVIGQTVQYLPGPHDVFAFNEGNPGPVAAIITKIDTLTETVGLVAFTPQGGSLHRTAVKYYTDKTSLENGFKKTTDPAPTSMCADEVIALAFQSLNNTNFRFGWEAPSDTIGTIVRYKETGGGTWKVPNEVGNLTGDYGPGGLSYYFTDAVDGQQYDVQVQNICSNNEVSAGVIITDTAAAPV